MNSRLKIVLVATVSLAALSVAARDAHAGTVALTNGNSYSAGSGFTSGDDLTIANTETTVTAVTVGTGVTVAGIVGTGNGTIATITNTGTISKAGGGAISMATPGAMAINNNSGGTISSTTTSAIIFGAATGAITLTNAGTITGTGGTAINMSTVTTASTITNTGTINGHLNLNGTGAMAHTVNINSGSVANFAGSVVTSTAVGGSVNLNGTATANSSFSIGDANATTNGVTNATFASGTTTLAAAGNDISATNIGVSAGAGLKITNSSVVLTGITTVANTGTLEITANVTHTGALTNNGTLALNQAYLTVAGGGAANLGTGAAPTLTLTIGSTALTTGRLVGAGNINMANGNALTVTPTIGSGVVINNGDKIIIASATGAMAATNAVTVGSTSALITWTGGIGDGVVTEKYAGAAITNKQYYIQAAVKSASTVAGVDSSNAASVNALTSYTGTNTGVQSLASAVQNLSTGSAINKAGEQTKPAAAAGVQAASMATGSALNTVSSRNDSVRTAAAGKSGISSGEALRGFGMWAQGFGQLGYQGEREGQSGYDTQTAGMAVGADARVLDNLRIGLSFGYANTNVDEKGNREGSGLDINSYIGTLYASYTGTPWYIDGSLSYGRHDYDSTRVVNITGFSGTANGSYKGDQYTAKMEGGYPLAVAKGVVATPVASIAYSRLNQDGYTETGTAPLSVDSVSVDSVKSGLGGKLAATIGAAGEWSFRPNAKAVWYHEFKDSAVDTTAKFAGASSSFTASGAKPAQDSLVLGLGLDMLSTSNLTLSANYDAELKDEYVGHTGILQIRTEF